MITYYIIVSQRVILLITLLISCNENFLNIGLSSFYRCFTKLVPLFIPAPSYFRLILNNNIRLQIKGYPKRGLHFHHKGVSDDTYSIILTFICIQILKEYIFRYLRVPYYI